MIIKFDLEKFIEGKTNTCGPIKLTFWVYDPDYDSVIIQAKIPVEVLKELNQDCFEQEEERIKNEC